MASEITPGTKIWVDTIMFLSVYSICVHHDHCVGKQGTVYHR